MALAGTAASTQAAPGARQRTAQGGGGFDAVLATLDGPQDTTGAASAASTAARTPADSVAAGTGRRSPQATDGTGAGAPDSDPAPAGARRAGPGRPTTNPRGSDSGSGQTAADGEADTVAAGGPSAGRTNGRGTRGPDETGADDPAAGQEAADGAGAENLAVMPLVIIPVTAAESIELPPGLEGVGGEGLPDEAAGESAAGAGTGAAGALPADLLLALVPIGAPVVAAPGEGLTDAATPAAEGADAAIDAALAEVFDQAARAESGPGPATVLAATAQPEARPAPDTTLTADRYALADLAVTVKGDDPLVGIDPPVLSADDTGASRLADMPAAPEGTELAAARTPAGASAPTATSQLSTADAVRQALSAALAEGAEPSVAQATAPTAPVVGGATESRPAVGLGARFLSAMADVQQSQAATAQVVATVPTIVTTLDGAFEGGGASGRGSWSQPDEGGAAWLAAKATGSTGIGQGGMPVFLDPTALASVTTTQAPLPAATAAAAQAGTQVTQQVVRAVSLAWRDGVGEATVRLAPEHLGEVSVALRVERGAVTAVLQAENASTREWIRAHESDLRQGLAEQGLQLEKLVVTSDGQSQQQQEQQPRQRRSARASEKGARFEVHV